MKSRGIYGAVSLAHFFLKERLRSGDLAVDATCGNGQDTLLLAELVGESGRVLAFDVQQSAIERTRDRLAAAGLSDRVELFHQGHQRLADHLLDPVRVFVFNLGYLPAAECQVKTSAENTLLALEQAQLLLQTGGLILVAVYTGHEGGMEEWQAVRDWSSALPPAQFNSWQARQLNRSDKAPFLVVVEKI